MTSKQPYNPDPRAHPGLHALAIFELVKGTLSLAAAASLGVMGPDPIRRVVQWLISHFDLDPAHGPLPSLLHAIDPAAVHWAVAIAVVYGVWRLVESWGLWRAKAWASWLGAVGTAAYLPFDLYALARHPGWHTVIIVLINLVVVFVLVYDLFRRRSRHLISH